VDRYLVFQLYGAMASWGDIAVGEHRPSFDHPSKSAVMGILAAALGIKRDEEEKHRKLAQSYDFAICINYAGTAVRDYHTAQVPPSGTGRNKMLFATRHDELSDNRHKLFTILSTRDYYCDAHYTVCLWSRVEEAPYSLDELVQALKEPVFTLYLGRKSCPPSLPLDAKVVDKASLKQLFLEDDISGREMLGSLRLKRRRHLPPYEEGHRLYWSGVRHDLQPTKTVVRRDEPISRKRWQFADRRENYTILEAESKSDGVDDVL